MKKILLFISVLLIIIVLQNYVGVSTPVLERKSANTISFSKENGTLIVHIQKHKNCILAVDAIAYEPYISPKATKIAVETQLLSNIQIIRVYSKASDGCFKAEKEPLSKKVWVTLSANGSFSLDEVLHPRMTFLKWIDEDHIMMHVSGEVGERSIDENVTYGF